MGTDGHRWAPCDVDIFSVVPTKQEDYLALKAPAAAFGISPEGRLELTDELWTSITPEEFPLTAE